jgi:hypothetical protein
MRGLTNLLEETLDILKSCRRTPESVLWVGSRDGELALSWGAFTKLAADANYDAGFGGQEIASDLVVVGDGWWLERSEYDGSESWTFKQCPVGKLNAKPFTRVTSGRSWCDLETMQQADEDSED